MDYNLQRQVHNQEHTEGLDGYARYAVADYRHLQLSARAELTLQDMR